jgi:hypothetical protein
MNMESKTDVPGVASHALFGRLLFVYTLNGVVKCFSADEIRPLGSAMLDIGWRHTATIDPARWIEAMANGSTEPSDMLDELQFCPLNAEAIHGEKGVSK